MKNIYLAVLEDINMDESTPKLIPSSFFFDIFYVF
jgi:hypothetical protein